ncbi:MAG: hypothetical protein RL609_647 [Bacteroidota bacterium]
MPTDLQSVLVGRLSISPVKNGAGGGIRTPDQLITNQLLWPAELHRHCFTYKTYNISKNRPRNSGLQMYKQFLSIQINFKKKLIFFNFLLNAGAISHVSP